MEVISHIATVKILISHRLFTQETWEFMSWRYKATNIETYYMIISFFHKMFFKSSQLYTVVSMAFGALKEKY